MNKLAKIKISKGIGSMNETANQSEQAIKFLLDKHKESGALEPDEITALNQILRFSKDIQKFFGHLQQELQR